MEGASEQEDKTTTSFQSKDKINLSFSFIQQCFVEWNKKIIITVIRLILSITKTIADLIS